MSSFVRYSTSSNLFVSDPASQTFPATYFATNVPGSVSQVSVVDALDKYNGCFVFCAGLTAPDIADFTEALAVYFANPARLGALLVFFSDASDPQRGVSGAVVYAQRSTSGAKLTRSAAVEWANFALSFPMEADVTVSGTGDDLEISSPSAGIYLAVTPFGERRPQQIPCTAPVVIGLLSNAATSGCLRGSFGLGSDESGHLDVGLHSFTAPAAGGYAQVARHELFIFGSAIPAQFTIDPLSPQDHTRSFVTIAGSSTTLTTTLRTAVGVPVSLTPTATSKLIFSNRLLAVDANGNPVILPSNQVLYLAPSGDFAVSVPQLGTNKVAQTGGAPDLSATLMCGLSAVEYLDVSPAAVMSFIPDQPAFAPTVAEASSTGSGDTRRVFGPLTPAGQTSWAYLSASAGSIYFAQPDSSVLHNGVGDASAPFLNYLPVQVGTLPPTLPASVDPGDNATGYPLLPYAAVSVGPGLTIDDLAQFELQAWAPARKALIQKSIGVAARTWTAAAEALPVPPYGTTPQGLLLQFDQAASGLGWAHLTLGNSPSTVPTYRSDTVVMSAISGALKEALQTNQLALVIAGADRFAACGSFPYVLNQERYLTLKTVITDEAVVAAIAPLVAGGSSGAGVWPDETALNTSLQAVLTQDQYDNWAQTIRSYTGDFSLFVADWEFDLSPWRWVDHNSIIIFKFCRKQLTQVVGDTSQWTQADAFNASAIGTQSIIADIFSDATARFAAGDTDLGYFVNTVMLDPNWNGILVLNAEVPLSGLPPQLEGLAAGIDASQFKAHHLGITVTPVITGATQYSTTASSAFGLIDYNSPQPLSGSSSYDFKVLSLKVRIANSDIASFSSTIEILVNELFGEPSNQQNAPDNNLILYGTYQKSGGVGSYSFTTNGATAYGMASGTLYMVNIETASFVTVTSNDNDPNNTTVNSRFQLNGSVSFLPQTGFDLFSYGPEQSVINDGGLGGGLVFSALSIDMVFDQATPTYRTFTFDAAKIVLDQSASLIRTQSLAAHFPMKLTGLIQAAGDMTPDTLGFMPVDSPVQGSELTSPWFGLQFELDLGSLGSLAAEVGFTARLLLAWAPNPQSPTLYIGLGLPGVSGGDRAISLQGVLKLAFGDVSFLVQPPTYILQLKNIALKFLSLSFPPNGQINMLMFGNPDAQTSGALGWYASYLKNGAGGNTGPGIKGIGRLKIADPGSSLLVAPRHVIEKLEARR